MNRVDDDKVKALIHRLALKYHLRDDEIRKIVQSPYKFTRETISNLEVGDEMTEEEFNKLKTNFIYVYIGKLYTSFDIYNKLKNLKEKRWKKK